MRFFSEGFLSISVRHDHQSPFRKSALLPPLIPFRERSWGVRVLRDHFYLTSFHQPPPSAWKSATGVCKTGRPCACHHGDARLQQLLL